MAGETRASDPPESAGTRQRLLEAARELFSEKGYAGTGTREIAARAGCNISLINHYFGSKDGLLKAILAETIVQGQDLLRALIDDKGPFEDRIGRLIDFMVDHFAKNHEGIRVFFREIVSAEHPMLADVRPMAAMNAALFAQLLDDARKQGKLADFEPQYGGLLLMGMLQFYFLAYPVTSRVVGEITPERIATLKRHIKRVFLRGVLA